MKKAIVFPRSETHQQNLEAWKVDSVTEARRRPPNNPSSLYVLNGGGGAELQRGELLRGELGFPSILMGDARDREPP